MGIALFLSWALICTGFVFTVRGDRSSGPAERRSQYDRMYASVVAGSLVATIILVPLVASAER